MKLKTFKDLNIRTRVADRQREETKLAKHIAGFIVDSYDEAEVEDVEPLTEEILKALGSYNHWSYR